VHRCMSYISAVGVLQSTNHMMVLPLQVAEFIAGLRSAGDIATGDFTPFELCYLTHPNAQFDPAKQWLKSAIFEVRGTCVGRCRGPAGVVCRKIDKIKFAPWVPWAMMRHIAAGA